MCEDAIDGDRVGSGIESFESIGNDCALLCIWDLESAKRSYVCPRDWYKQV